MTPVPRQPVTAGTGEADPAGTSTLADTVRALEAELATLQAIAGTILSAHDVEQVLLSINERLLPTLDAEIAGALLIEGDELVMKSCVGHQSEATTRLRMRRGQGLAGLVSQTGEPQKVDDCVHDRRISRDVTVLAAEEQVRSALAVPLRVRGQITGVLQVWRRRPSAFTGEDSRRMQALAGLAAIAIDNAHLHGAQSAALRELADARSDLDAHVGLLHQSATLQRRLTELVLSGSNSTELVRTAAEETGCGVVVVTREGAALASHPAELASEAPIRKLLVDDAPAAGRSRPESVTQELPDGRVAWRQSIRVGVEAIDSVYLIGRDRSSESGTAQFAELVATAIANTEWHARANRLTEEQAALRRVATLVARGVRPAEIFSAVSEEVGPLFGSNLAAVVRFDPNGPAIVVVGLAQSIEGTTVGSRWEFDDARASADVYRTGRSARVDAVDWSAVSAPIAGAGRRLGIVSTVASPILVEGRLWGCMSVAAKEPLPLDAEERLEKFTDLVATAIANAEARAEVERLAEEQAALRRVATLVAEGAPHTTVFDAVAAEMEGLLGADRVSLSRYEFGAEITVLAHRGSGAELVPSGSRLSHEGDNVQEMVRRTERPARMEKFEEAHGRIAEVQRTMGVRVVVAAPVVVDGRVWGVIGASWVGEESPPADTEERMARFAGLLETAIANADSRDQLTASRARLVTEADEARRRVVRDLHDGAQQRLVHAIVTLKLAQQALQQKDGEAESLIGEALEQAEQGTAELRELAHGILPSVLMHGGLRAGVDAVMKRLDLPVQVGVPAERFAEEIEASAYFIVAEALTNVVKHSHARHAEVKAFVDDGMLHVVVRDDGLGGADPEGHGLVGMADRVTALGGRLDIESPADGGTRLAATLPVSPSR